MKDDPIVEEVRKAGEAYLATFDFDLKAACKDLQRQSDAAGRKTISLPPRPATPQGAGAKRAG